MEINKTPEIMLKRIENLNDKKEYTFVFDISEDNMRRDSHVDKIRVWQVFPSVCASMLCIPFGMMLGWPSPTYPKLLQSSSIIPITIDQSAVIAGALMIGNTIITPFSSFHQQHFETKYSIITSAILMVIGWIIMWQAKDIYWLLLSRLFVGLGNGYGIGQLKNYIQEICEEQLAIRLIKQIPIYINFGIVLSFTIGPFIELYKFNLFATIIAIIVLFLMIFLPTTPQQLIRTGRLNDAKKLIKFLNVQSNVDDEIVRIQHKNNSKSDDLNWLKVWEDVRVRWNGIVFIVLVFFQQFSGMPPTIIYTQIFFKATQCPYAEFCAIVYIIVYLFANIFAIHIIPKYNKKLILIISCITTTIFLLLEILIILFEFNRYFNYISLLIMVFFNIFHSFGLGNIPNYLIADLFPTNSRKVFTHLSIMLHSMFALIITKIFQVLYDQYNIYVPLCLFCCITFLSIGFVIVFIPKTTQI